MLKEITNYLTAEQQESLLFILVGVLAIGVAVWLWMNGHRLKSMAFPLVAIAVIQLVVGGTVYLRTDSQVAALTAQLNSAPAQLKSDELKRMDVVMKNFALYKGIEMVLLTAGLLLVAFAQKSDLATGFGAGLLLQSAFMLCLDMFAEARGKEYLQALAGFSG